MAERSRQESQLVQRPEQGVNASCRHYGERRVRDAGRMRQVVERIRVIPLFHSQHKTPQLLAGYLLRYRFADTRTRAAAAAAAAGGTGIAGGMHATVRQAKRQNHDYTELAYGMVGIADTWSLQRFDPPPY